MELSGYWQYSRGQAHFLKQAGINLQVKKQVKWQGFYTALFLKRHIHFEHSNCITIYLLDCLLAIAHNLEMVELTLSKTSM